MLNWITNQDSAVNVIGDLLLFIAAVGTALTVIFKFRPIKWVFRTVFVEPFGRFFRTNTAEVVRNEIGEDEAEWEDEPRPKLMQQISDLRDRQEKLQEWAEVASNGQHDLQVMMENLHRCLDRRSAETHSLIAKLSDYAELIYAEAVGSRDRLRHLYRALDMAVFEADANGMCTYVNPAYCKLTGLSVDEALGRGWSMTVPPDERHRVVEDWRLAVEAKVDANFTHTLVHAITGEYIECRASASPLHDGAGNVVGWVGTVEPITSTTLIAGG